MSAAFEIAELDKSLAKDGEWVILRRVMETNLNIDVRCRAFVRPVKSSDLIGAITENQDLAILSPTQINRAQWPGGHPESNAQFQSDPRLPHVNDQLFVQGRQRTVAFVKSIVLDGELIRIELTVT